jgi:energy-coupling factor transporter ATP-binding protein EcfA2
MVERLESLTDRRLALRPVGEQPLERATRLRDHLSGHLRVRARSLEAPLLVLLLGPTGAGKSTLFNTIAGRPLSPTGVLRPTTRTAVVLANTEDRAALTEGPLSGLDAGQIQLVSDPAATPGLAVVDAPDIDSVEHANRVIADRLVEAADLCIFVTTASRYADRVPWNVLGRVSERGLPLVVVVNRLPPDADDRREVLDDVSRLFNQAGGATPEPGKLEIVGIEEGRLAPGGASLDPSAVGSVIDRIAMLRSDRDARMALAARALAGALGGLGPAVDQLADDCAHEAIDDAALRRSATDSFDRSLAELEDVVGQGMFLREEALRHWQEYVGADDVTRMFSRGIGAVRGMIASIIRPSTAPVAEVRDAATDDLLSLARQHAAEASRRTAAAWTQERAVAAFVAADPTLWTTSNGFDERFRARVVEWIDSIAIDIAETGEGRRKLARRASIGINAVGTGVMLATFIHTAGLTGAEVGIAAGTAFLNQKLLGALFGEAAMVELVARARDRLRVVLAQTFAEERDRFERLVPAPEELEALAGELRAAAHDLRALSKHGVDALASGADGRGSGGDPTGLGVARQQAAQTG